MNQRLVILGAGESGIGAALLGQKLGFDVFVSEYGIISNVAKQELINAGIYFEESGHTEDSILSANLIIKSPGIPEKAPIMKLLREQNKTIISEIEFASRFTEAKLIAITGSNGKTTTTKLTHFILKNGGIDAAMVGNVGDSFARELAKTDHDVFVIEVSSFQLDDISSFHPYIAVLTNLSPDHLDRYNYNYSEYIESKFNIISNQTEQDFFVYSDDDEDTKNWMSTHQIQPQQYSFSTNHKVENGAYIEGDTAYFNIRQNQYNMSIYQFALKGKHNASNSMAATIVSELMGIRKEVIRQSLQDFQSLEHRMEPVASIRGIEFINDSKATNVNSTWYALESMTKPVVWIAGGVDKGNNYASLLPLVKQKVKALVCLGKDNAALIDAFSPVLDQIEETESMSAAVRMAYYLADNESIVLLSPACASFDLFSNYEDRGNQFKQAVREL